MEFCGTVFPDPSLLMRNGSMGFRCNVMRLGGTYAKCQHPGILALPSAWKDVLPGPVYCQYTDPVPSFNTYRVLECNT